VSIGGLRWNEMEGQETNDEDVLFNVRAPHRFC
jgi:hypothetical protein